MWTAILKPEITRKHCEMRKKNNLLKTKVIVNTKYKLGGAQVFTFSLPGGRFAPLLPINHANDHVHFKQEQSQVLLPDPHVTISVIQQTQDAASML